MVFYNTGKASMLNLKPKFYCSVSTIMGTKSSFKENTENQKENLLN